MQSVWNEKDSKKERTRKNEVTKNEVNMSPKSPAISSAHTFGRCMKGENASATHAYKITPDEGSNII